MHTAIRMPGLPGPRSAPHPSARRAGPTHCGRRRGGGVFALLVGGITAIIGRAIGGTTTANTTPRAGAQSTSPPGSQATPSAGTGTVVATVASVPVGRALSFTNAADGSPAWVVHPSGNTFVAFSAICTHAGCTVDYDPSNVQFNCPCHSGVYDARTGQVLQGPPPLPLASIAIHVANGEIRVN